MLEKFIYKKIFESLLGDSYKELIEDVIGFVKDERGNGYLSKDLLKISLNAVGYLKDRLEEELDAFP